LDSSYMTLIRLMGRLRLFLMGKAFYETVVTVPSLSLEISMYLLPPTEIGDLISQ
jgi:hypothetical protein